MSLSLLDWHLASAKGLPLTSDDCLLLLDSDLLETDGDLLKNLPYTAKKVDAVSEFTSNEDLSSSLYPPSPLETKPTKSQLATDFLNELDAECKQENIFPNWLEEKVELPIFEPIHQVPERVELLNNYGPTQPTEVLLREFESVYGAVELTHLTPLQTQPFLQSQVIPPIHLPAASTQLTPPQSPPLPATQLLLNYAHQASQPHPQPWNASQTQADIEQELAVVEEVVRQRSAHLPFSSDASPHSSPPSSPSSSANSSSAEDDWHVSSRRPKPYGFGDDRRSRKKEQNKNAATRYRQKKKAEVEVLLNEENRQRQLHNDLDTKCTDLQREIRYLKGLMRDLFKAKGLIK